MSRGTLVSAQLALTPVLHSHCCPPPPCTPAPPPSRPPLGPGTRSPETLGHTPLNFRRPTCAPPPPWRRPLPPLRPPGSPPPARPARCAWLGGWAAGGWGGRAGCTDWARPGSAGWGRHPARPPWRLVKTIVQPLAGGLGGDAGRRARAGRGRPGGGAQGGRPPWAAPPRLAHPLHRGREYGIVPMQATPGGGLAPVAPGPRSRPPAPRS